jgi:DNA-binding transcriptional ArsR family regulator
MIEDQLTALAVGTRRQIYVMLIERPRSVRELADELPVTRPAVSQHLKVLTDAGLAKSTHVGTSRIYSADPSGVAAFRRWADQLWSEAIGTFADFANAEIEEEEMSETNMMIEPVVKAVSLALTPEAAFDLFTEQMTSWWPLESHSVGEARAVSVRIEPTVGGRIIETTDDGVEHEWGKVTAWDTGKRVEFTWYPGLPQDQQTVVDVRFREIAGGSEMLLVHSGWEARGEDGPTVRENYNKGWDYVLGQYRDAV